MKVVIAGGTGLIGSALAHNLAQAGHEIVVLTRNPNKRVDTLPDNARLVGWDARTAAGWGGEADGADALVNLVGESISPQHGLWTAERRQRIQGSRVAAGQAMVEAVGGAVRKPRVLLQASATGYYGPHGDERVTEATPPGSDFLAEVSRSWEASTEPVEPLGVRHVILRTGLVLARKGGLLPVMALPFRLLVGGPLGSGKQGMPWIHMDDQIGAMRFLIENEQTRGPFNLTAPNPVSNRDFSKTLAKVLGRPSLLPTPAFVFKAALGAASTLVLDGQFAIPDRLQEAGYDFRFPNLEGALRDLLKP